MGAHNMVGGRLSNGKKNRGSVKNASRLDAFANGESKGEADWSTCSPEWIHDAVHQITQLGGAMIFGMSRDGGAHSVTLMLDDARSTLYFNGDADLNVEMEAVCTTLENIAAHS